MSVSTIMPNPANFSFPPSPGRPRPISTVYTPPSALKVEAGPLPDLSIPSLAVPAGPTLTVPSPSLTSSPSKSPHHSHRRSAAVSHDFNTSPIFSSTSPQSPGSSQFPYNNKSPTLTFASSSFSLQQSSYTFSASATSLPLEETSNNLSSPKKKNLPKVSFVNEPENIPTEEEDDYELSLSKSLTNPSTIKSSSSSSTSKGGVSKSKSRRLRHKKVKSWAGNLIRFGSSRKDHKRHNSQEIIINSSPSSNMDVDDVHQPSYIPTILFNDSSSFSPEPKIDLDAALNPFRMPSSSALADSEFNSHQYFHRRSESAPEISLAPAFRNMKRKMGPVEEEPEDDSTSTNTVNNQHPSPPRYYTSRGYKSSAGTSPVLQSQHEETESVFTDSTTSVNSINSSTPSSIIRVVSQLSDIEVATEVSTTSNSGEAGSDLGEPGPEIRCSTDSLRKKQFSPHASNSSLTTHGQTISGNRNSNRISALIGRRLSQDSSSFTGSSLTSSSKRNPASRVWGWIRGKKNSRRD